VGLTVAVTLIAARVLLLFTPIQHDLPYQHQRAHIHTHTNNIYRGADKSLAQPGRKKATATEDFEFHISYFRGKQWQATPKNLPRMQRTKDIPVA